MASLKKCIEAMCKSCCYDQHEPGTWRSQVENCGVTNCALWEVRPKTVETVNMSRKGKTSEFDVSSILANLEDEVEA